MSYTTLANVANMFPTFQRGGANQKPADAQVQVYIDDVAGELDAILERRFAEAISGAANFSAWIASLGADGANILEKINRYGAAAQLGVTLASQGIAGTRDLARHIAAEYEAMKDDLDARKANGEPLPSGPYDHLFDPLARTETPRPVLKGVAGADQDSRIAPADMGQSNVFGKFDKRGT